MRRVSRGGDPTSASNQDFQVGFGNAVARAARSRSQRNVGGLQFPGDGRVAGLFGVDAQEHDTLRQCEIPSTYIALTQGTTCQTHRIVDDSGNGSEALAGSSGRRLVLAALLRIRPGGELSG